MDKYYEKFIVALNDFVSDLNRYYPNEGCENFIQVFDKLQMGKVIMKYLTIMRPNKTALKAHDETLFDNDFVILPEINMYLIWPNLTTAQKSKTWKNLNILFILSELLMTNAEKENQKETKVETTDDDITKNSKIGFNPYLGIMPDNPNPEFTVESLFSGPETLPGDEPDDKEPGMMGGIGDMFNMRKWANEIKNLTPESIDEATKNLVDMLGPGNNSQAFTCLIDNINKHLKNTDISKGNPIKNLKEIANMVSGDLKNKMESGELDLANMMESTADVTKNFTANLNGTDSALKHPLKMFSGIFDQLNNPNIATEDKIQNMNNTMKKMGFGNIMKNMENMDMSDPNAMANLQKQVYKNVKKR